MNIGMQKNMTNLIHSVDCFTVRHIPIYNWFYDILFFLMASSTHPLNLELNQTTGLDAEALSMRTTFMVVREPSQWRRMGYLFESCQWKKLDLSALNLFLRILQMSAASMMAHRPPNTPAATETPTTTSSCFSSLDTVQTQTHQIDPLKKETLFQISL